MLSSTAACWTPARPFSRSPSRLTRILAPVVALAYARGPRENRDLVSAWNIVGIGDLVIAVSTGLLTSPSPLQRFAFDLPNELISAFPLVLIPTYLVPVSVLLHLASLAKLHRTAGGTRQAPGNGKDRPPFPS